MQIDPAQPYVQQHLKSIIIHSLDNLNYKNAEFASERLLSNDPKNFDFIYLYCLALFKQGRHKSVYNKLVDTIDENDNLGCAFVFAKLCVQLKKYKEGIYQLLKLNYLYNESAIYQSEEYPNNGHIHGKESHHINSNDSNNPRSSAKKENPAFFTTPQLRYNYEQRRRIYPDLSTIYHLLGDLYKAIGDVKNSALNYSFCLKYNQFNFEAFQELCKLGANVKIKTTFKSNSQFNSQFDDSNTRANNNNYNNNEVSHSIPSFQQDLDKALMNTDFVNNNISNPFATTPINNGNKTLGVDDSLDSISTPRVKQLSVPDAPLRKSNFLSTSNTERHDFPKPNFPIHSNAIITPTAPNNIDSNSRKGKRESTYSKITSRLISQPNKSNDSNSKNTNYIGNNTNNNIMNSGVNVSTLDVNNLHKRPVVRSGLKRNNSNTIVGTTNNISNENSQPKVLNIMVNKEIENGNLYLLRLYMIFAKAFKSMSKFDCYKSIRILETLPDHEKETPWVLSKLGRLHYEIVNYKQSEYFFTKLRKLDRARLEDMEYYSTLLWHLHKRVELTYLANELHDLDKNLAVTWCVIGNLFSLTREPDEAIKCFSKSIKIDENFTYAYTLKGHEYFSNDNYEMALENFRISLLIDSRHYNALYGIGMVYINLGDYQKADYHFRKAVSINPVNIILICCVGMVLEKMGKKNLALRQYELANKLQPLSALPIFKKAQLLFSMQQFPQALKYFEQVKELAPNEASVHFLLGQLYNIQNDKFQAIREFTIALNLDPKGNYLIREAMESLQQKS